MTDNNESKELVNFPEGEEFKSLVVFNSGIFVATSKGIYQSMGDRLTRVKFEED